MGGGGGGGGSKYDNKIKVISMHGVRLIVIGYIYRSSRSV